MQALSAFLLVVFILIAIFVGLIVHETGHFFFAKLFKVSVKEYAIGIGPKLYSKQFKNTKFSFNLLPVMAFVRIDSQRSLTLFKELRDEYQKEADQYYLENKNRIDNPNSKYIETSKSGRVSTKSNYFVYKKYQSLLQKVKQYDLFSTRIPGTLIVDDIPKWKQEIIYFGGIFFNLILFTFFYLIQYFGFSNSGYNNTANPFVQVGESFFVLLKNMVFYNAWGVTKSAGTAFGSVAEVQQQGGVPLSALPFVLVNYFAIFNLMLFLFNFIPIPPLDGYKIVCCLSPKYSKIKIPEKLKNGFELFGMVLMIYIFVTAIIADFMM
ncbi:MAG: site-2 protease family protein [Malacoplasma sp.]|nr:site-2 protease family protein [Malacoplasma sp.]MDE6429533.1 site-2 protease family protein [Malacoplasma sp.]